MRILIFLGFLFIVFPNFAGEIVIEGKYSGKDIYVRNPFIKENGKYCIQEVWVNDDKVLDYPEVSAVRVSLSHLALGKSVRIRLVHSDFCTPQVLNPGVLSLATNFRFIKTLSTNNSIEWTTEGEIIAGSFVVEVQKYDAYEKTYWDSLTFIPAKGELGRNFYSVEPKHVGGDNYYRIKYLPLEGRVRYSAEIIYTSTDEPIYILDDVITTNLEFSKDCEFTIKDSFGRFVTSGFGDEVYLEDLKPGEYFVTFQNRTERFVKK